MSYWILSVSWNQPGRFPVTSLTNKAIPPCYTRLFCVNSISPRRISAKNPKPSNPKVRLAPTSKPGLKSYQVKYKILIKVCWSSLGLLCVWSFPCSPYVCAVLVWVLWSLRTSQKHARRRTDDSTVRCGCARMCTRWPRVSSRAYSHLPPFLTSPVQEEEVTDEERVNENKNECTCALVLRWVSP